MKPKLLLLLFVLLLVVSCKTEGVVTDLPPPPGQPGDSTQGALAGRAYYSEGGSFADPTGKVDIGKDRFTLEEELTINVQDETLVYSTGKIGADTPNAQWEDFDFSGDSVGRGWLQGNAQHIIDLQGFNPGRYVILAYACSKQDSLWDCHNRQWMAHSFEVERGVVACNSVEDCPDDNNYLCVASECVLAPEGPDPLLFPLGVRCSGNGECQSNLCGGDEAGFRVCTELNSDPVGARCVHRTECQSGLCGMGEADFKVCTELNSDPLGARCSNGNECLSSRCGMGDSGTKVCSALNSDPLGARCLGNWECQSNLCGGDEAGFLVCTELNSDPVGARCVHRTECQSGLCGMGEADFKVCTELNSDPVGARCQFSEECQSNSCVRNVCT